MNNGMVSVYLMMMLGLLKIIILSCEQELFNEKGMPGLSQK